MEHVGQLSIYRVKPLGSGRFGQVFLGKAQNIEVAVKQMKKKEIRVDSNLLLRANEHPNIVNYNGMDSTGFVFMYLFIFLILIIK